MALKINRKDEAFMVVKQYLSNASQALKDAKTFEECAEALGFDIKKGVQENMPVVIETYRGSPHPCETFLILIAPYVTAGGSIDIGDGVIASFDGKDVEFVVDLENDNL